ATSLLGHPLAHDAGVTFLSATAESEARLRLLDADALLPGQEAWAQLVLDSAVALTRGDHCVIRTSNDTVAGGVIVATNPRRHRRNHAPTLEAMARQLEGTPAERLHDLLLSAPLLPARVAELLRAEPAEAAAAIDELLASRLAVRAGDRLYARTWLDSAAARAAEAVDGYLAANPLRPAVPREHVRSSAKLDAALFDAVVAHAMSAGRLEERGRDLAPPGYAISLSARQQSEADAFLAALRQGGYNPPTDHLPEPNLLAYLSSQGLVVDTGGGVVFDPAVYRESVERIARHIEASGSISLAEVRDLFGTSRKYAQALLEHLDATHVTRRVGDARVLRATQGTAT
ncbi:MAG: SelB C-terminal domain-containing protein, partial [Dehalococcoidia bacterium]